MVAGSRVPRVAVVVFAAGLVGGCGEGAGAVAGPPPSVSSTSTSPSVTTTPSPSPSATGTGPVIPEAARQQTDAGAEAFIRYYIEQSGLAWTRADPSLLDGLATSRCVTCSNLRDTAAELKSQRRRYTSMPIRVDRVERLFGTRTRVVFELQLTQPAVSVVTADGDVVDRQDRWVLERAARVVWTEGRWQVDGISE